MKPVSRFRISYLLEHGILAFLAITFVALIFVVGATVLNPKYEILLGLRVFACTAAGVILAAYFVVTTARAKQWLFALAVLNIAANVIVSHKIYLDQGWTILVPFFGLKLLAVAAALAAPALSFPSYCAFSILMIAPLLQYFSWSPAERAWVGWEEPWITIGFVIAAQFIWFARRRGIELMRQKSALAAQNETFKRFALMLLGAQHLMNSPLQSIAANVRLIELENPGSEERIRAIDRAFEIVQKVGKIISFGDSYIHWNESELPTDLDGFSKTVRRLVQQMNEHTKV